MPVAAPVIDPAPFRPYRTYHRVDLADSVVDAGARKGSLIDAGIALGRSYRVGWGSHSQLVSLRGVYDRKETQSDVVKVEKLKLLANQDDGEGGDKTASLRLLRLQLAHTQVFPSSHSDPSSSSPVPFASPLPTLRFHHFAELYSNPTTTTKADDEKNDRQGVSRSTELSNSPEAQLFKLASHLFDEVSDLGLDFAAAPRAISTTTVTSLRRRQLLSEWLSQNLVETVSARLHDPSTSAVDKVFLLLTTHDVARACDLALTSSNARLATLISQVGTVSASETDRQFQLDLERQVVKWNEYKVDSHVSKEVRRIYELLSGNVGTSRGRGRGIGPEDESEEFHVLQGCEWKAAFAMGLWYSKNEAPSTGGGPTDERGGAAAPNESEVARALELYERGYRSNPRQVAPPLPRHVVVAADKGNDNGRRDEVALDPVYHLLKLYTSPTHSLEESLAPKNFGPSGTDYRMPWHLYLLLSRVLRRRDFDDRIELDRNGDDGDDGMRGGGGVGEEEEEEGNSVRADQVTTSYASQLESIGLWEWSVFVLLHLELEAP